MTESERERFEEDQATGDLLDRVIAENGRLRAELSKADDHPLVMAEGGTDGVDRCHRVINKQANEIERLHGLIRKLREQRKVAECPAFGPFGDWSAHYRGWAAQYDEETEELLRTGGIFAD